MRGESEGEESRRRRNPEGEGAFWDVYQSAIRARRRRFIHWLLGASVGSLAGLVFYPVLRFLSPPVSAEAATSQVDAGPVNDPELLEKGFKIVPFGNEPVILVRDAGGGFRALSATCTHLDCTVEFRPERQILWCNCHNGQFDLSGQVLGGPPPAPLRTFRVHEVDGSSGKSLIIERV